MQSQPETLNSCTNAYMVHMWHEKKKKKRTIACYKRICIMHDKQQKLGTSHLAQQIENQRR